MEGTAQAVLVSHSFWRVNTNRKPSDTGVRVCPWAQNYLSVTIGHASHHRELCQRMDPQLLLRRKQAMEEGAHPVGQACSKLEKLESNARNREWRLAL